MLEPTLSLQYSTMLLSQNFLGTKYFMQVEPETALFWEYIVTYKCNMLLQTWQSNFKHILCSECSMQAWCVCESFSVHLCERLAHSNIVVTAWQGFHHDYKVNTELHTSRYCLVGSTTGKSVTSIDDIDGHNHASVSTLEKTGTCPPTPIVSSKLTKQEEEKNYAFLSLWGLKE